MTAKEYLQQLKRLDTVINKKIQELSELRTMSTVGSFEYKERVQSSTSQDAPFVKIVNKIIELEEEINNEINKFIDKKHMIINQILTLNDSKYIELLYKKYVEFKKLEVIAIEMNYTYQYTRSLHGYALQEFKRIFPNL